MNKFNRLPAASLLALSLFIGGAALAAELESQTNREGAVTVKATPKNISANARTWDFEISLSTHSVPLDQDMARAAVLIADTGKPQAPQVWEGDPPGGHHRKGVLRFQPTSASPHALELHIDGVGGVKRIFRWRLIK